MKICISCGAIVGDDDCPCPYCKSGDLRSVKKMRMFLGKFEGDFELSSEEKIILDRLKGHDIPVIKDGGM